MSVEGLPGYPWQGNKAGMSYDRVFDPALKHYDRAFRPGEPSFTDDAVSARWHAARRHVIDAVLAAISGSGWADHLVLRGSITLQAWFGAEAREPGDLDFVAVPRDWTIDEPRTGRMLTGICELADRLSGGLADAAAARHEDIWTYERVPGRRVILPWRHDDLPTGFVQLDFVFNEDLPLPPQPLRIPRADGGGAALLQAASPELSLLWKLQWLISDAYPQAKDLYDAVLLTRIAEVRTDLLQRLLEDYDSWYAANPLTLRSFERLHVDYEHFSRAHPRLEATAATLEPALLEAIRRAYPA